MDGIRVAAAGAAAQSLRHDVIANNLANVSTVGFRRQLGLVGARPAGLVGGILDGALVPAEPALVATVPEAGQGPLAQTGRATDLALEGEGFFVVTDGTNKYYTRAGNFDLDKAGRLVTADHRFRVLAAEGQPIVLDPAASLTVDEAGTVLQDGAPVGRLAVVAFRNPERLTPVGGGLLAAPVGLSSSSTNVATVRQGYLEQSTVEAVRELVAMLEAYRAYEANVNLIGQRDQAARRLIDAARIA